MGYPISAAWGNCLTLLNDRVRPRLNYSSLFLGHLYHWQNHIKRKAYLFVAALPRALCGPPYLIRVPVHSDFSVPVDLKGHVIQKEEQLFELYFAKHQEDIIEHFHKFWSHLFSFMNQLWFYYFMSVKSVLNNWQHDDRIWLNYCSQRHLVCYLSWVESR